MDPKHGTKVEGTRMKDKKALSDSQSSKSDEGLIVEHIFGTLRRCWYEE